MEYIHGRKFKNNGVEVYWPTSAYAVTAGRLDEEGKPKRVLYFGNSRWIAEQAAQTKSR